MEQSSAKKKVRRCPLCGGELVNQGMEPVGSWRSGYLNDDKAMLRHLRCKKCGRDYDIFDPTAEERETEYKQYWDKQHGD